MAGSHGQIWKKRILLPLWVAQLGASVVILGLSALALWAWNNYSDEVEDEAGYEVTDDAIDTGAAINFAFSLWTMLSVFVEIVLYCTHRLSPVVNLVLQCIKSAIWIFYFVLAIIAAAQGAGSGVLIFLVIVLCLSSLALLAYGAVQVHRKRKGTLGRGTYAAASPGPGTGYEPSRYSNQTTGYTGTSNPNPFRDPSPAPPYNPNSAPKPSGEAAGYYGGSGSYEMQQGVVR